MLDNRIYTFLKLCELMNYRATAESLSMTQPAVTQHIQGLERDYGCRLFIYKDKKLIKTRQAADLQRLCQSAYYNEIQFRKHLSDSTKVSLRIGATKTIGDYVIGDKIASLLCRENIKLSVYIDNTECLLEMLDKALIDFAIIEGFFDKQSYEYSLLRQEEFVGVCSREHEFAGKTVALSDLFCQTVLLREEGSGTRAIFEQILSERSYSLDCFKKISEISSFELIKKSLLKCAGITFAYKTIADSDDRLAVFKISQADIFREFNFVYLKDSCARELVSFFMEASTGGA